MTETIKKKPIGKNKGNAEERKVAKELSAWFFNDPDVLKRHPDSGATKSCYCGDVIPMKQLIDYWEHSWPFIIEVKTGYPTHLPTFYNCNKVQEWFGKAYHEGKINNQNIVLLITRFKGRSPLLITNYYIKNLPFTVLMPYNTNGSIICGYVYDYKSLFNYSYDYVFNMDEIRGRT